ncbi:MAG TPA: serine hydrolase [Acidimicrobiia bacterium]|nr:serine hydrolase [Acidimicrobiia bacterium]
MGTLGTLALALALASPTALAPLTTPLPPLPIAAFPDHEPPALSASAWAIYSVDRAAMIWASAADEVRPPASVTKLMTALLVVEAGTEPTEQVTISAAAAAEPIGYVGQQKLYEGELWEVEALLTDLLIYSDNGAAVALAERVAGSVEAFVALMNRRAAELGMTSTNFENPNGLDETGHVSSARDLIRLGAAVLAEPRITRITRVKYATFTPGGRVMEVRNTNRLLGTFPGILGLKTGDTLSAGQVLLSYGSFPRGDFLAVVMGTNGHIRDTRALMGYALRTLGPKDHFYSVGADLPALAEWPAWLLARIHVAGDLDGGRRPGVPARLSPAERDVAAALTALLPRALGGGGDG